MREFLHRITHSLSWFIGFVIFLLILWLFLWRLFDQEGFTEAINGFINQIKAIFWSLVRLVIVGIGFAVMFGWRPFRRKGGGH